MTPKLIPPQGVYRTDAEIDRHRHRASVTVVIRGLDAASLTEEDLLCRALCHLGVDLDLIGLDPVEELEKALGYDWPDDEVAM